MRDSAVLSAVAALTGALLLSSGDAEAFMITQSAAACLAENRISVDTSGKVYKNGYFSPQNGWQSERSETTLKVYCPVPDADRLLPQDMEAIYVYGYDGSSTDDVVATAYVKYWDVTGGAEWAVVNNAPPSYVGEYRLEFPRYPFDSEHEHDYKSIRVRIPAVDPGTHHGNTRSSFRGVVYSSESF